MHGLLKVVYGQVDVSVYSKVNKIVDIPQTLLDKTHLIDQGFVVPTEKLLLKSLDQNSEALLLSPGRISAD